MKNKSDKSTATNTESTDRLADIDPKKDAKGGGGPKVAFERGLKFSGGSGGANDASSGMATGKRSHGN